MFIIFKESGGGFMNNNAINYNCLLDQKITITLIDGNKLTGFISKVYPNCFKFISNKSTENFPNKNSSYILSYHMIQELNRV